MITKICQKCGDEKPISEFYAHSAAKDGFAGQCKECAKAYFHSHGNQKGGHSAKSGRPNEQAAINKLLSLGIYATSGSASSFSWVDIVAWGCVKIEVKSSSYYPEKGAYLFAFSRLQQRRGIKGDFILLNLLDDSGRPESYHLIPASHPVFYKNGHLKTSVAYMPGRNHAKNIPTLTVEIMMAYEDAWYQIEERRLQISEELRRGVLISNEKDGE